MAFHNRFSAFWSPLVFLVGLADGANGKEPNAVDRILEGHTGSVLAVGFSPDGTVLVTGSRDHTIKLWGARTGHLDRTLSEHAGDVYAVVFSPKGDWLASSSKDTSIKFWDAQTGKLLRTLTGHTGRIEPLAFSPDGNILATGGGGGDTSVRLWDLKKEFGK
ncbi:MAG: WD40 repeat domain-containing protein [Deltaproteobacteria bacterium]